MDKEIKVTECLTFQDDDEGPSVLLTYKAQVSVAVNDRPAILLWKEDYDAMRKELTDLREYRKWHEGYKQILKAAEAKVDE